MQITETREVVPLRSEAAVVQETGPYGENIMSPPVYSHTVKTFGIQSKTSVTEDKFHPS